MPTPALLQLLDWCPPFICYYAAQRNRDRRPTLPELVMDSGMSQRTFSRIAHRTTWAGVTVEHMSQFTAACGIDPLRSKPVMVWLAKRLASGKLTQDFDQCRGQGKKMIEQFSRLSARAVLQGENQQ